VSSRPLVVVEVRFQDAPQTGLIQHNHVIQAFPTNRADQSLNVGVGMSVQLRRMAMLKFDVFE
jgi:hypothetical protein